MQNLLSDLTDKLNTYYEQNGSREDFYNIFKVLGVAEKEVIMCRMLADLIDPRSAHGQGNVFLKRFLDEVLELEYTEEQLNSAAVYKEYPIPESERRIDIVIQMQDCFIPIEVKINAKDQKSQCYDYWTFSAEKMGDKSEFLYYLTKGGNMPSDDSLTSGRKKLSEEKIKTISFEKDIRGWLKNCTCIDNSNIKLFIEQYLDAIEDFTGAVDEDIAKVAVNTILSSREFLEKALLIEKTINDAKVSLMKSMFEEFERQMDYAITTLPFKMSKMGEDYCYYYKEQTDKYYGKKDVYPCISYSFDDIQFRGKKKLLLYIAVYEHVYVGLVIYDEVMGDDVKNILPSQKRIVEEKIKVDSLDSDWCFGYLPDLIDGEDLSDEKVPNFKTMQGMVTSFVDKKELVAFVEKSVKNITDKLIELAI